MSAPAVRATVADSVAVSSDNADLSVMRVVDEVLQASNAFGFETIELVMVVTILIAFLVFRLKDKQKKGQRSEKHQRSARDGGQRLEKQRGPFKRDEELSSNKSVVTRQASLNALSSDSAHQQKDRKGPVPVHVLVKATVERSNLAAVALAGYSELRAAGRHRHIAEDLKAAGSKYTAADYFAALVQCAGRQGRGDELSKLLDDMVATDVQRTLALYESAMRLLASMKCFESALSIYDRVLRDNLSVSCETLSCLTNFAMEAGQPDRAIQLFEKLSSIEAPSARACVTILRVYAQRGDWEAAVNLVRTNWQRGAHTEEPPLLNMALGTCVAARRVAEAEALLEASADTKCADTVSYNTVLKGFASERDYASGYQCFSRMCSRGIVPNAITHNTLLDAASRASMVEEAWRLFDLMEAQGVEPDKYTCSTLIKALRILPTVPRLSKVMDLVEKVLADSSPSCAKSLLGCSLCVALRLGHVDYAMRAFALMRQRGITPEPSELRSLSVLRTRAGCPDWTDPSESGTDPDSPLIAQKRLAALDRQLTIDARKATLA